MVKKTNVAYINLSKNYINNINKYDNLNEEIKIESTYLFKEIKDRVMNALFDNPDLILFEMGDIDIKILDANKINKLIKKEIGLPSICFISDKAIGGQYYVASACNSIIATPNSRIGGIGILIDSLDSLIKRERRIKKYSEKLFNLEGEDYVMIKSLVDDYKLTREDISDKIDEILYDSLSITLYPLLEMITKTDYSKNNVNYLELEEYTKSNKVEETFKKIWESTVDEAEMINSRLIRLVASNRRMNPLSVSRIAFKTYRAQEAIKLGLIDYICDKNELRDMIEIITDSNKIKIKEY